MKKWTYVAVIISSIIGAISSIVVVSEYKKFLREYLSGLSLGAFRITDDDFREVKDIKDEQTSLSKS